MNEGLVLKNQTWAEFTHDTIYLLLLLLPLIEALQPIPPRLMTYVMKNAKPDQAFIPWGFWNKKASLDKGDSTWYHQIFCAIGLMKHRGEMILSRTSRESVAQPNTQLSWGPAQYLTSPLWLSPSANRDTTNTARASTAPVHTFVGTRHLSICHVPGHLRHAEKCISFQAHNCFLS